MTLTPTEKILCRNHHPGLSKRGIMKAGGSRQEISILRRRRFKSDPEGQDIGSTKDWKEEVDSIQNHPGRSTGGGGEKVFRAFFPLTGRGTSGWERDFRGKGRGGSDLPPFQVRNSGLVWGKTKDLQQQNVASPPRTSRKN